MVVNYVKVLLAEGLLNYSKYIKRLNCGFNMLKLLRTHCSYSKVFPNLILWYLHRFLFLTLKEVPKRA